MSIIDDYKQLQMIENVKKIKEMELCYRSNLKLCKQQEKQINKLATCIEEIEEIANAIVNGYHFTDDIEGHLKELAKLILNRISEVIKNE